MLPLVWLTKQRKRQRQRLSFQEFILNNRAVSYAWLRLKYFNLQRLLHAGVHGYVLVFFLSTPSNFGANGFCFLIGYGLERVWWGGLEPMRSNVKAWVRQQHGAKAKQLIEQWLSLAVVLSAAMSGIGLIVLGCYPSRPVLAMVAILTVFATRLPVIVYHSGAYALNRVYWPARAILGLDATLLLGALFFFHNDGGGLIFWFMVRTCILQGIVIYFVRQVYQFHNMLPFVIQWRGFKALGRSLHILSFAKAGVAMATMVAEKMLLVFWVVYHQSFLQQTGRLTLILLSLPYLYAVTDWAQLFYYDFKRHFNNDLALFQRRFEISVLQIAAVSGLVNGCLIVGIAGFFQTVTLSLLCCIPLLGLRSLIAVLQVKYFSHANHRVLVLCNLTLLVALFLYLFSSSSWLLKSIFLASFYGAMGRYLYVRRNFPQKNAVQRLSVYAWLSALHAGIQKETMRLDVFSMPADLNTNCKRLIMRGLTQHFIHQNGKISQYKNSILLFNPSHFSIDTLAMLATTSGWIRQHKVFVLFSPAPIQQQILPLIHQNRMSPLPRRLNEQAILQQFFWYFPYGVCFNPTAQLGPDAKPLAQRVIRGLLYKVKRYLNDPDDHQALHYFLSVYYAEQHVKMIFVIPKINDSKDILHPRCWQQTMNLLSKENCVV